MVLSKGLAITVAALLIFFFFFQFLGQIDGGGGHIIQQDHCFEFRKVEILRTNAERLWIAALPIAELADIPTAACTRLDKLLLWVELFSFTDGYLDRAI